MLINLMVGLGTMIACLTFQAALLVSALKYYANHQQWLSSSTLGSTLLLLIMIMLLLVLGNLLQVALWAYVFMLMDEFTSFRTAFYHSAVNFATLGYGDLVMSERHRLLGPLEAINGVIMIGVSTATLMATMQDAFKKSPQYQS